MAFAYSAGLLGGWTALDDAPPQPPRRVLVRVAGGSCAGGAADAGALCCGTLAVSSLALQENRRLLRCRPLPTYLVDRASAADCHRVTSIAIKSDLAAAIRWLPVATAQYARCPHRVATLTTAHASIWLSSSSSAAAASGSNAVPFGRGSPVAAGSAVSASPWQGSGVACAGKERVDTQHNVRFGADALQGGTGELELSTAGRRVFGLHGFHLSAGSDRPPCRARRRLRLCPGARPPLPTV